MLCSCSEGACAQEDPQKSLEQAVCCSAVSFLKHCEPCLGSASPRSGSDFTGIVSGGMR